jgi:hypothetical protein
MFVVLAVLLLVPSSSTSPDPQLLLQELLLQGLLLALLLPQRVFHVGLVAAQLLLQPGVARQQRRTPLLALAQLRRHTQRNRYITQ